MASWMPLQKDGLPEESVQIRTGVPGELSLSCADGSELHLGPDAHIEIRKAFFDSKTREREFRVKLIYGRLEAVVGALGPSELMLRPNALERLEKAGLPKSLGQKLSSLVQQRFPTEERLLEAVKNRIGEKRTRSYKTLLLEIAQTRRNIFAVESELSEAFAGNSAEESRLLITADPQASRVDAHALHGQFLIRRLGYKGNLHIIVFGNQVSGEGLAFAFNTFGGEVYLKSENCNVSLESSVPPTGVQTLSGIDETLIRIANSEESPDILMKYGRGHTLRLEQEQQVLLYVAGGEDALSVEFTGTADVVFDFCQHLSSFAIVEKGCPEIDGEKNCYGIVDTSRTPLPENHEMSVSPLPTASPSPSGGSYLPPENPPVKPGSPILP